MREITRYIAMDGREFATPDECRAHEREHLHAPFVGLTLVDVEAIFDCSGDPKLEAAFVAVARRIARGLPTDHFESAADPHRAADQGETASPPAGRPQTARVGSPDPIRDEGAYLAQPAFLDRTGAAA